jgi:chemotaxis protein methyltransferase CheR
MIDRQDYQCLKDLLRDTTGHSLGEGKEYLIERRLTPIADSLGLPNLGALLQTLRKRKDRRTIQLVCEAMTTNESLFFRDNRPFDILKQRIIPELLASRAATRTIRIWSAACSTGQEAYSIAMILDELRTKFTGWRVEIFGTDYSPAVVSRASEGLFNHFEVQRGLPVTMLIKYFEQVDEGWQIKDSLRSQVTFREGNLLQPFTHLGKFDVIFCRNVLIYFDADGKRDVLERMKAVSATDGYLFLGSAETTLGVTNDWRVVEGANTTLFQQAPHEADSQSAYPVRASA